MTWLRRAVLTLATTLLMLGCSGDGTTLREPGTGGATPRPAPDDAVFADGEGLFALRSLDFASDGPIPAQYSRSGGNNIPDLRWRETPPLAEQLALVVTDADAGGLVHWLVTDIPVPPVPPYDDQLLPLATGVIEWPNDFGEAGWTGPIASDGGTPHHYVFTLHALTDPVELPSGTPREEVLLIISERTLETTVLVGTY